MPVAQINGHEMYFEEHGNGEEYVLCMGGWGTYCHGKASQAPAVLFDRYRTLLIDYRGVGESTDPEDCDPSMGLHADDAIALCDHLGISGIHVVGLIGMGACVGQEMAIRRPDLVKSLFMMGSWSYCDALLTDQLNMYVEIHRQMGFLAFQKVVASYSFPAEFYEKYRHKILGEQGAWSDLDERVDTHARLVEACLKHDSRGRLNRIACPTFVLHAGNDVVTTPRITEQLQAGIPGAKGATEPDFSHVPSGSSQRAVLQDYVGDFLKAVSS